MNVIISFLSAGFAWYRLAFHSPFPINHFRVSSARICDCCVGVHTSVLDWYDDFASGVRFCSVLSAFADTSFGSVVCPTDWFDLGSFGISAFTLFCRFSATALTPSCRVL